MIVRGIRVSVLDIYTWPAKVLETRAEEVTEFDSELKVLAENMHETMKKANNGIGLAANQVGILKRVLTILIPHDRSLDEEKKSWHDKPFTFVNPVITKRSQEKISCQEGCLSLPGVYEYVDRSEFITVEAFDEHGKKFTLEADDMMSICLQHEIDHLDGITVLKRISRLKSGLAKKRLMKKSYITYTP